MEKLNCPLRQQAIAQPEETAIYQQAGSISFGRLDKLVNHMEQQLTDLEITANTHLGACDFNSLELIVLMLACFRQSIVFCPINPRLSQPEQAQMLSQADISWLWHRQSWTFAGVTAIQIQLKEKPVELTQLPLNGFRPANIIFTSGSSGAPKAAVHNLANHYYSALGSKQRIPLTRGDIWLASLPLFHIGGLALVMRCLFSGASIAIPFGKELVKNLKSWPVTHVSMVPTQLLRLLAADHTQLKLKHLLIGGAAIPKTLLQEVSKKNFNSYQSYGLTELSSQVSTNYAESNSTGKPLPYREVKILKGEILVRGLTLFLGYYRQGKITPATKNSWFHTKDMGTITSDGLHVSGRKDNMFICGGENIQPEQLEQQISQFTEVIQSIVVPIGDKKFGFRPAAFVQWKGTCQQAELHTFLEGRLARFKLPLYYFSWQDPATSGLKVSRKEFITIAEKIQTIG